MLHKSINKISNTKKRLLYEMHLLSIWIACLKSPKPNVLRGIKKWRWLMNQRLTERYIEPSIHIHGNIMDIESRLLIGKDGLLDKGVVIAMNEYEGSIFIDDRVYIGPYSFLGTDRQKISIGKNTMIGANSYIIANNHITDRVDIPYRDQGFNGADVRIEENVWIGCHVKILPGITIGNHAIIGAGAVVTKNIPDGEIWAGVPAKKLKHISENSFK